MNQPTAHNMYFIAILCPSYIDDKILRFKQWMKEQFGCVVALKSPSHITLIPPFWLDIEQEPQLIQILNAFNSDLGSLEIQLKGFSHFGKRVLFVQVVNNAGLQELKIQVESHFVASFSDSIKPDDRSFQPHVTIATRDIKPSDFMLAWDHFMNKNFDETFSAITISLLKLHPGRWNILSERNW